jgi:predicted RNA polymerase sigma factor
VTTDELEQVWRRWAPDLLAALARRYGDFDAAEDAVQDALLAAVRQWPIDGVPDNPKGWLITVASRRLMDQWRSNRARTDRQQLVAQQIPVEQMLGPAADAPDIASRDDSLSLLLLCCHPALTSTLTGGLDIAGRGGVEHRADRARVPRA